MLSKEALVAEVNRIAGVMGEFLEAEVEADLDTLAKWRDELMVAVEEESKAPVRGSSQIKTSTPTED